MISKHISLEEATFSQTAIRLGIKNIPGPEIISNMKLLAKNCFEPLREHFKVPIKVSSFYRCPELNKKIGGSKTSQHMTGQAIDLQAISHTGINNEAIFNWLKNNVEFDQLINEYNFSWVHVSYEKEGNRKQILVVR